MKLVLQLLLIKLKIKQDLYIKEISEILFNESEILKYKFKHEEIFITIEKFWFLLRICIFSN